MPKTIDWRKITGNDNATQRMTAAE
jgi:hypothetical protein